MTTVAMTVANTIGDINWAQYQYEKKKKRGDSAVEIFVEYATILNNTVHSGTWWKCWQIPRRLWALYTLIRLVASMTDELILENRNNTLYIRDVWTAEQCVLVLTVLHTVSCVFLISKNSQDVLKHIKSTFIEYGLEKYSNCDHVLILLQCHHVIMNNSETSSATYVKVLESLEQQADKVQNLEQRIKCFTLIEYAYMLKKMRSAARRCQSDIKFSQKEMRAGEK